MESEEQPRSPYLTIRQAVEYTTLSDVSLYRAVREGRLRQSGLRGAVRFHKDDLDRFMRGETAMGGADAAE